MRFDFSKESVEKLLARIRKDTTVETAVEMTPDIELFYIIEVQGFAPELMDGVSFRRTRQPTRRLREIKCPHCGGVFETVDTEVKVTIHSKPEKPDTVCHSFRPCKVCHRVLGVMYASRV